MKYSELMETYLSGVDLLNSAVEKISETEMDRRPARPDAWTIREHLIHLVDSEVNGFIRIKSIIAQPGSECYVMDEELWTRNLCGKIEDVGRYLQLFALIRSIVYNLLKDEPDGNWTMNYFTRTYGGETKHITLKDGIELYCNHLTMHLDYIAKILSEING